MAAYTVTAHLQWVFTDQTDYDNICTALQNVGPNVTLSNVTEDSGTLTVTADATVSVGS